MPTLAPHYVELVEDAILKIHWYKLSFRAFLARCGGSYRSLASFNADETKRAFLARLLPSVERTNGVIAVINNMTDSILEQKTFPDLTRIENSKDRLKEAKASQTALRSYVEDQRDKAADRRAREQSQEAAKAVLKAAKKRNHTLQSLQDRLTQLHPKLGTTSGGYAFETWVHDLIDFFELPNHRHYRAPNGRQIDGSVTLDGPTYLLEMKFEAGQSDVTLITSFRSKLMGRQTTPWALPSQ